MSVDRGRYDGLHFDIYPIDYTVDQWGELYRIEADQVDIFSSGIVDPASPEGHRPDLPKFNGYAYSTALHREGECDEHRPDTPIWEKIGERRTLPLSLTRDQWRVLANVCRDQMSNYRLASAERDLCSRIVAAIEQDSDSTVSH